MTDEALRKKAAEVWDMLVQDEPTKPRWAEITDAQREEFVKIFRRRIIDSVKENGFLSKEKP